MERNKFSWKCSPSETNGNPKSFQPSNGMRLTVVPEKKKMKIIRISVSCASINIVYDIKYYIIIFVKCKIYLSIRWGASDTKLSRSCLLFLYNLSDVRTKRPLHCFLLYFNNFFSPVSRGNFLKNKNVTGDSSGCGVSQRFR